MFMLMRLLTKSWLCRSLSSTTQLV